MASRSTSRVTRVTKVLKNKDHLALYRLIPNMVTLMALVIGFTSIRFSLEGKWELAVSSIVIAGILDALDGRLAVMLKATSQFGAELDSLCDFVNFGVAPSLLIYLWLSPQSNDHTILSWSASVLFVSCMSIRLARFNVTSSEHSEFFKGVPAPSGALLALMPVVCNIHIGPSWGIDFSTYIIAVNIYTMFIGILLAGRFPTLSIKKMKVRKKYVWLVLLVAALCMLCLFFYTWYFLPLIAVSYLLSIPVLYYYVPRYKARKGSK